MTRTDTMIPRRHEEIPVSKIPGTAADAAPKALFPEARRRRRQRRWMWTAAVILVATLAVVLGLSISGRGGTPIHSSRVPRIGVPRLLGPGKIEAPRLVFRENPYMGISCSLPNPVACDRVGLIVRLQRPAVVTATIDGLALRLNDPTWSGAFPTGRPTIFIYAGFLQPAHMTTRMHVPPYTLFVKSPPPPASVWFRIDFGHGKVVLTHEEVQLEPGWA
jgi:hypothetical protein